MIASKFGCVLGKEDNVVIIQCWSLSSCPVGEGCIADPTDAF